MGSVQGYSQAGGRGWVVTLDCLLAGRYARSRDESVLSWRRTISQPEPET